jgi:predicted dehydrogenase/threonine dehydrogenase-like Zn-dependent dehydrogenase
VQDGHLLIRTAYSLVSAGTERMLVDFGKANPLEKARQQPDKVKMVLDKIKTDGLQPTLNSVRNKLEQPLPLGYCNSGYVMAVGKGVEGFSIGDRVASNGKHAEVVCVPKNLCVAIPDSVTDEHAAFTVAGSIALQGLRLANPTLGEAVVVTGLGLIGQLTVQLLRANGCRVLGIDFDKEKLDLVRALGAEVVDLSSGEDPVQVAERFSKGHGVDAVIVTAATKSNEPMHQAALMCRKRGRIVLTGVTGLELSRDDFFKKELTFQVSASYGPGRYDSNYEEKGHDYPIGFVRWTEQRNFEAVLDMMSDGRLDVESLISHRYGLSEIDAAYAVVVGKESSMGILLEYPKSSEVGDKELRLSTITSDAVLASTRTPSGSGAQFAFIGAGNYAAGVLIPAFKSAGANLVSVASNSGLTGVHAASKFGFSSTTTDANSIFQNDEINAVVVSTRHDSHAQLVLDSLNSGKHVFVEKPLCLNLQELEEIEHLYSEKAQAGSSQIVMVGFNRRFSPQIQKVKSLLSSVSGPKSIVMTVNAGAIPSDHWTQDKAIGGGRIVGEACHFIDLLRHLIGYEFESYSKVSMDSPTGDTMSLHFEFVDGSIGTVHYFAEGNKAFPKERLEVFASGNILQLDNFRKLTGYGWKNFKKMNLRNQDKGQTACSKAFVEAVQSGTESPIPFEEIAEVSRVAIILND